MSNSGHARSVGQTARASLVDSADNSRFLRRLGIKATPPPPPPPRTEPVKDASPPSARSLTSFADLGPKTGKPASTSGPDRFFARAVAGARTTARNPRRGLLPALLCLPVLLGLAAPAAAQTTPTISPSTLIETGVANVPGSATTVTVSNIPSDWVTPVNHALTTTGTGTGHAILANATNCGVADTFGDSLDTYDVCDNQSSGYSSIGNSYSLSLRASIDTHSDSGETFTVTLMDSSTPAKSVSFTMTINDPPVRIGVTLPEQEGVSRVGGKQPHEESTGSVAFDLSADEPLANNLTVCVQVSEQGGSRVAAGDKGIQTATLLASGASNGSGTYTVSWTDTAADDPDSSIIVRVVAPEEAGCSATDGSYAASGDDPSDQILIRDDEDTTVELTASDPTMTEGDASDTATLTVSLSRQLYAGETIGVPIALASATGARLPGSVDGGNVANHDFTVGAAAGSGHSGVTLTNALTANPRVVFTGHGSNTVQTATVTLTPVANRDDGDAAHETITATLSSLGLLDTTVSGVAAHATNNAATLTLEDDEAAPPPATCPAQNPIFSDTNLRILETGETTYCVRLTTAPSGGDTTVTIGRIGGGATASPTSLTFTSSNYQTPQQVTVTGADESGSHRNRTVQLTHTANGGGYSSTNLGRVRINVDDAPEVEAFWYIQGDARIRRPHTVTSTPGLTPWRNAAPGERIPYVVRLSNRPEPGGTVTVTATVPSRKRNLVGLSLTKNGDAQDTVMVEFKDRSPGAGTGCSNWLGLEEHEYIDSRGYRRTVSGGGPSESYDGTADTPWECWRMIYVVRLPDSFGIDDTCADITHTATGGGVRKVTVDTIRAHVLNPSRNRRGSPGQASQCRNLTGNTLPPQGSPAEAAPAPTEAVTNVQVTAVDDASATVTWDAVEHATSYDVSWSAESSDSLSASAGVLPGVIGTSATIQHDAQVAMTLTVTVTPEYIDENGDTQQLESLAATATLEVGPQPLGGGGTNGGGEGGGVDAGEGDAQASAIAACVSADLMQHVEARIEIAITDRWERIRNALFGQPNAITLTEVKEIYENRKANGWDTNRLEEVIAAMECIESAMQQTPVPGATPDPTPDSESDSDPTPDPDPEPEPVACVSPQLRADAEAYAKETWRESADHVERWLRVLQTFSGTANDATVMTPTEAEEYVNRGWERWVPVLEALKCMEQQALDSG